MSKDIEKQPNMFLVFMNDVVITRLMIVAAFIASTSWFKFLNTPISTLAHNYVEFLKRDHELPKEDNQRYFVSSKRRLGIHGYGRYTRYPVALMTSMYSIEIEELMGDRFKVEPLFVMGTRSDLMKFVKGLSNKDFDNAKTMEYFRELKIESFIKDFVSSMSSAQHVFRHLLGLAVSNGTIKEFDGYVFSGHNKNCELGDFLYKYYDSFITGYQAGFCERYNNVEMLARDLVIALMKQTMGLTRELKWVKINTLLRDSNRECKIHSIFKTVGEGTSIPSSVIELDPVYDIIAKNPFDRVKDDRSFRPY